MVSGFEILIILLIIFIIGIVLSFSGSNLANSIVERIADWCLRKMEGYESKSVSRLSVGGVIKTICSVIVKAFKYIDMIENPKLRTGIKLNAVFIIVSIAIAIISFAIIAVFYLALILVSLYILYRLIDLWYRHEKGLPLFPYKNDEHYEVKTSLLDKIAGKDRKTIYNSVGKKVGDISTGLGDKIAGKDRRTIRDTNGNKVGDISTSLRDKIAGKDRRTIRDADGSKVGDISTSLVDQFAGKDRKTIRDASGNKVGDIKTSPIDKGTQIVRTKKLED